MIRYILFDLDGTLTESGPGIIKGVQYALQSIGIEETDTEKLRSFVGPALEESFATHYGFSREESAPLIRKYKEYYDDGGVYENRPYDGIMDVLKALREEGYFLCITSSKPQDLVEKVSDHFGMTPFFSIRVGSSLDRTMTEKEDVIRYTMECIAKETGRTPEDLIPETVMVGDRKYDVRGAHIVGIPCIGVLYGYGSRAELEDDGADLIAETPADIATVLKEL